MKQGIVPDLLRLNIAAAVARAKMVSQIPHTGLQGTLRESLVGSLFRPLLPPTCSVEAGTIVDALGTRFVTKSPLGKLKVEDDVVIVDREAMPPFLVDASSASKSIIPIESVLARLEIKTTLDATELRDAIDGAIAFNKLVNHLPEEDLRDGAALRCLFAFDTDLTLGGKTELERFEEQVLAAGWSMATPPIVALCVVGRGLWIHTTGAAGFAQWKFCPATSDHNEVLGLIGVLMNTLRLLRSKRVNARLGDYVLDPGDFADC